MLVIRLQRTGRKGEPTFRLVVTDKRNGPKSRRFVDIVGSYDPRFNKAEIDSEKIKRWVGNGAQPSNTVHNILVSNNIIEGRKINVLPKKTPIKKEEVSAPEEEKKPKEEPQIEETEEQKPETTEEEK